MYFFLSEFTSTLMKANSKRYIFIYIIIFNAAKIILFKDKVKEYVVNNNK